MRSLLPYALRQRIKGWPGVLALRSRLADASQLAGRGTMLCVEGFPRSGNGFAFSIVRDLLPLPAGAIAHHTHSPANIRRAVRRGLPTYVLIREPQDCCASLAAWGASRTLDEGLVAYEAFHRALEPVLDRVTLVPFEVLTADPGAFLRRAAEDLGLPAPVWDEAAAAAVEDTIRRSDDERREAGFARTSLPSDENARRKAQVGQPSLERLARCRALRDRMLAEAPDVLGRSR